jgi:poly(3-hydroxybutyrate) depolymerase
MNQEPAAKAVTQDDDPEFAKRAKSEFDLNSTAIFSCRADPRFSYTMYVPPGVGDGQKVDLLVAIHGSSRDSFLDFRDGFAAFGRWNTCAVLCPLFPIGVLGDDNRDGYKYLAESDIRYDQILDAMVEEVAQKYQQDWDTFGLFGYSGGGHFTHRYAILHPQKLWAVSIGAPGSVTRLDPDKDWWVGIRDLKSRFGVEFDAKSLARVPVHMIVGESDLETWEITHKPGGARYMEGANDAGRTRPERMRALQASFEAVGVKVRFDAVPGVSHDRMRMLPRVQDFLADVLKARRNSGS